MRSSTASELRRGGRRESARRSCECGSRAAPQHKAPRGRGRLGLGAGFLATARRPRASRAAAGHEVRSPSDGQVIRVHARVGECIGEGGIAEVGRMYRLYASAELYETDIKRVSIGQRLRVESPAPTEQLLLTVDQISLEVRKADALRGPGREDEARVVEVAVALDRSELAAAFTNVQGDVESIGPCDRGDRKLRSAGPRSRASRRPRTDRGGATRRRRSPSIDARASEAT